MIDMLFIAFIVIYISISIGFSIKLSYYGVKNNKFFLSIYGPLYIMCFAILAAWTFIKAIEKKENIHFSKLQKVKLMFKLNILNIQWFPAILGFGALAIYKSRVKNKKCLNEDAQKRQTIRLFNTKSHKLYNDFINPDLKAA